MPWPSESGWRKEMESPPSLGLGTIYITLLRGRTDFTIRVSVGWLPLIVSYVLISLKACSILHLELTHTHTYTFI